MGLTKKRKTTNSTAEQKNSQATAQPASRDTRPVDISQQEETEILQSAKDFAQKCKENFEESTLNWFIGWNCLSLVFYFVHIGFNIYWLITYYAKGDMWYFRCTLAFWLVPAIIMIIRSFRFYNPGWRKKTNEDIFDPRDHLPEEESDCSFAMKWVLGLFCPIPRYCDAIKYALKAKQAKKTDDEAQNMYFLAMIWEDVELLQLRQFDTFMESAPQLLLGLYIAIKEKSLFEYLLIFKILTFGILSWALVSYDKKICLMSGIKKRGDASQPNRSNVIGIDLTNESEKNNAIDCVKNFNWKESALSFFAHFSWMVARFMAFSLFATVHGWVIWMACLAHLVPILVLHHRSQKYNFMASLRLSFLHVFAYLDPAEKESDQEKHPRFSPVVYQTVCICENLFLMVMWSQSLIKFDERINLGILSISYYPWNDWTFFLPWLGQILTFLLSCVLLRLLNKERQSPITAAAASV